jgi:serine/threonine-protein kinase
MSTPTTRPPSVTPTADRWAAIEAAFGEASRLGDTERATFLDALGRNDAALAAEVRSLLAASDPWWLDEAAVALPDIASQPSQYIGSYRLVRPLGRGGMGEVWLAVREHGDFRQPVALKIVRGGLESAELIAGFKAERQILASLNHPNIAHLLDVGETDDGRPYLALEFVEGVPITAYCDAHRLSIDERLNLFRGVCDAVRFAHQNLVVHRDLKPSNILVSESGAAKLLDFGIAKVLAGDAATTLSGDAASDGRADQALTPGYASPEQIEGTVTTTASDVYALGVILYELLAGRRPYHVTGKSRSDLLQSIRNTAVRAPSAAAAAADEGATTSDDVARARGTTPAKLGARLSGDLDAIVLRAIAPAVSDRYASVEQLVADIDRSLTWQPVTARPRTAAYLARRFVRRHRVAVFITAIAFVGVAGFVSVVISQSIAIRERSVQAERERQRAVAVSTFLQDLFRGADPTEARGATITARELLDRGATRVERELASQPATRADFLMVMSEIYQNLGLYAPAEQMAANAVGTLRTRRTGDDSALANSLVSYGKALHYNDRPADAVVEYRAALDIRRRLGDTTSASVAQTLAYLGSALQDQRDDSTAERYYRQSISIERTRAEYADTVLAFTLNNLGVLLRHKGDLKGAEAAYREALDIRRASLGEDHPETIRTLNNLAIVVGSRDLGASEPLFIDVLARWRRVLGADHPTVAYALTNLGGLYMRRHEPAGAVPFYTEALAIRRARLTPMSSDIATSLWNLGSALDDAGDLKGAEQRYKESLVIRSKIAKGPNDAWVARLDTALATLHKRMVK